MYCQTLLRVTLLKRSVNKITYHYTIIYAAAACGWSALRRYSGSLASKSAVKAVSCLSLSFKIS